MRTSVLLCVVLNLLYASFSMIAPLTLSHVDALIFTAFQLVLLAPGAMLGMWHWRAKITRQMLLTAGSIAGCLTAGFLLFACALQQVGIIECTILAAVNGVLAAIVGWKLFHQRLSTLTWLACGCALIGAISMSVSVPIHWQGSAKAFLGGALITTATFLWEQIVEHHQHRHDSFFEPLLSCQFLIMAVLAMLIALAFGNWQTLGLWRPADTLILLYCSIGTVLLPILLATWIQLRQLASAVTIAFFAILDPLASTAFAIAIAGERLPWLSYAGTALVLGSMVLQSFTHWKLKREVTFQTPPSQISAEQSRQLKTAQ